MLDSLSDKLQDIFGDLQTKGRLTEEDINAAMREIRLALLEADVNYRVVKDFVNRTRERCLTSDVLESLTPVQNVIKIVTDELTTLLGSETSELKLSNRIPNVIMLVGLQGSGKTTACSKLAYLLKHKNHTPLLVACDVYRPAAADQLETLGKEIGVKVYRAHPAAYNNNANKGLSEEEIAAIKESAAVQDSTAQTDAAAQASSKDAADSENTITTDTLDPVQIAKNGVQYAIDNLCDVVIIDTAGRLHVDEAMMAEAAAIKQATQPEETLMVVDAMTGQDVVNVVSAFAEQVDFDGVIMSKMDGDARGGGALSIREVTGKPIKFISAGEHVNSLEVFHPDRMAKRILGMGDVLTLIENAVATQEEEIEAEKADRLMKARITLDDFIDMNERVKKLGGIRKLVSALPGGKRAMPASGIDEHVFDRMVVIINSMTKEERTKPEILNASRRMRIARGAGVTVTDVNLLIKKFNETKKMFKKFLPDNDYSAIKGKRGKKGKRRRYNNSGIRLKNMETLDLKDFEQLAEKIEEEAR